MIQRCSPHQPCGRPLPRFRSRPCGAASHARSLPRDPVPDRDRSSGPSLALRASPGPRRAACSLLSPRLGRRRRTGEFAARSSDGSCGIVPPVARCVARGGAAGAADRVPSGRQPLHGPGREIRHLTGPGLAGGNAAGSAQSQTLATAPALRGFRHREGGGAWRSQAQVGIVAALRSPKPPLPLEQIRVRAGPGQLDLIA